MLKLNKIKFMIKHCITEQVKLWSNATKQEEQYV